MERVPNRTNPRHAPVRPLALSLEAKRIVSAPSKTELTGGRLVVSNLRSPKGPATAPSERQDG
jgi:hypothetical protein